MSLPSGTFQESYAQDMAIFRTKTQWVLLADFPGVTFHHSAICLGFDFNYVDGDRHYRYQRIGSEYPDRQLRIAFDGPFRFHDGGRIYPGDIERQIRLAFLGGFAGSRIDVRIGRHFVRLAFFKNQRFLSDHGTVAAYFIIHWLILQFRGITGGTDGISVPEASFFGLVIKGKAAYFYLVMIIAVAATYLAKNILRTRAGTGFRSHP